MKNNIIFGTLFFSFLAQANAAVEPLKSVPKQIELPIQQHENFSASLSFGYLSLSSQASIYHAPDNIGDLKRNESNWEVDSAAIIGMDLSYQLMPWFSLHARAWTLLSQDKGSLDVSEWYYPSFLTARVASDTELKKANEIDFYGRAWLLSDAFYHLGLVGGFQSNYFEYLSSGGLLDDMELGKSYLIQQEWNNYHQHFYAPYVGFAGLWNSGNFEMSGLFKWSSLVMADSFERDHLREMTFDVTQSQTNFYAVKLDAGYYFTPHSKLFLAGTYTSYLNARADLRGKFFTGDVVNFPQLAGMESTHFTLTLGLRYRI